MSLLFNSEIVLECCWLVWNHYFANRFSQVSTMTSFRSAGWNRGFALIRASASCCCCSVSNHGNELTYYSDVIRSAMASQFTGVSSVYSTICSGADQRKYQSAASLAFVRGIHQGPVNSPHKGPVTRKMFPFDDVIYLYSSYIITYLYSSYIIIYLYSHVFTLYE